jgi:hypothetical protein
VSVSELVTDRIVRSTTQKLVWCGAPLSLVTGTPRRIATSHFVAPSSELMPPNNAYATATSDLSLALYNLNRRSP